MNCFSIENYPTNFNSDSLNLDSFYKCNSLSNDLRLSNIENRIETMEKMLKFFDEFFRLKDEEKFNDFKVNNFEINNNYLIEKINDLENRVNEKDNKIEELNSVIKNLKDKIDVLTNNNNILYNNKSNFTNNMNNPNNNNLNNNNLRQNENNNINNTNLKNDNRNNNNLNLNNNNNNKYNNNNNDNNNNIKNNNNNDLNSFKIPNNIQNQNENYNLNLKNNSLNNDKINEIKIFNENKINQILNLIEDLNKFIEENAFGLNELKEKIKNIQMENINVLKEISVQSQKIKNIDYIMEQITQIKEKYNKLLLIFENNFNEENHFIEKYLNPS